MSGAFRFKERSVESVTAGLLAALYETSLTGSGLLQEEEELFPAEDIEAIVLLVPFLAKKIMILDCIVVTCCLCQVN